MISQYVSIVTAKTESRNMLKILAYTWFCAGLIQHWFINAENKCTFIRPTNTFHNQGFFFFVSMRNMQCFFFLCVFSFFGTLKVSMWLHVSDHVFNQSSFKTIYPWRCFILLYMDRQPEWVLLACSVFFHSAVWNVSQATREHPEIHGKRTCRIKT